MQDLKQILNENIILLDGATGTNLQRKGMPAGVCPELWILEHPKALLELQQGYREAGSRILYAPTFSGNRVKLREYGLEGRLPEINRRLTALTRQAAGEYCYVAGNLTMTGASLAPVGDMDFEELVDIYKEQVQAIAAVGADLFVVETMMSVQECRAAVLAVKETTELPVFVTITLEENGRTLYGSDPVTALVTLQALGADAFGINCSAGPDALLSIFQELGEYARIPLIAKPNAGLPRLVEGRTVFDMPKEEFAAHMKALVEAGASIIGGCCGTDPSYIAELSKAVSGGRPAVRQPGRAKRILTSERGRCEIGLEGPFLMVGERINPTGKKKLQEQLRAGDLTLVGEMAREQAAQGAALLDINVGMGGIDEKAMMEAVVDEVASLVELPLCIDSSSPQVVEAALRRYPGRALVNSVSCEQVKLQLLPVVKKYGAMFILLPLTDEGLPGNQKERWDNICSVWEKARALGFEKEDLVVDGLVAAVAAEPMAARETLATIKRCRQEGFATICGLSNISFGLPERAYVNSVFLAMAVKCGLTMAIANPSQGLFNRSVYAADLLLGRDGAALRYVENSQRLKEEEERAVRTGSQKTAQGETARAAARQGAEAAQELPARQDAEAAQELPARQDAEAAQELPARQGAEAAQELPAWQEQLYQDVLKGRAKQIKAHITDALKQGAAAEYILNHILIPSINEVGELFNRQRYFLPQLILSAKAMETGVAVLEPGLLACRGESQGPTVVIATVKGDIHDIGKNLVALMMRNYGFRVIDLGKDVDKKEILGAAAAEQADVIALSALMTTTMSYMREVIAAAREAKIGARVIVGGAAVTEEYAREIGADGYSKDAVGAVELIQRLLP
ncbi:MAG: dihydropteroate synthase [Lachnospiraceae bacterium]|nr:dihydropteroate synthase [Lachnospiraceae bacterium]